VRLKKPQLHQKHPHLRLHLQNLPLMELNLLQRTRLNPHLPKLHLQKRQLKAVVVTTIRLRLHNNRE
jgi:hypothetical protein